MELVGLSFAMFAMSLALYAWQMANNSQKKRKVIEERLKKLEPPQVGEAQ